MSKSIFTSSLCRRHRLLLLLLPKTANNFSLYFHPTGELGVSLVYYSSVSLTRFWKVWSLTPKGYSDILHRLIHSNFFCQLSLHHHCSWHYNFLPLFHWHFSFLNGDVHSKNSSLLLFKKSPSARDARQGVKLLYSYAKFQKIKSETFKAWKKISTTLCFCHFQPTKHKSCRKSGSIIKK